MRGWKDPIDLPSLASSIHTAAGVRYLLSVDVACREGGDSDVPMFRSRSIVHSIMNARVVVSWLTDFFSETRHKVSAKGKLSSSQLWRQYVHHNRVKYR